MRPARRPLRGPSGSSSARSASRWSVRPLSGSSRSQPSSKRSSAQASSPSTGRRRATRLANARSSSSCAGRDHRRRPSPRPPPGIGSARQAARSPRIQASGASAIPGAYSRIAVCRSRSRSSASSSAAGAARRRRSRRRSPGRCGRRHSGIGRQHLEALERHQQRALGERRSPRDSQPMPAQQREHARARCARSTVGWSQLAVGRLEALRRAARSPRRSRRTRGGRSSAARPARRSPRRGAAAA